MFDEPSKAIGVMSRSWKMQNISFGILVAKAHYYFAIRDTMSIWAFFRHVRRILLYCLFGKFAAFFGMVCFELLLAKTHAVQKKHAKPCPHSNANPECSKNVH